MTKQFTKIESLAAAAIFAGLILPQIAMAGSKGRKGGSNRSHQARRASFNHGGNHGKSQSQRRRRTNNDNRVRQANTEHRKQLAQRAKNQQSNRRRGEGSNLMARVRQTQQHGGNFRHNNDHHNFRHQDRRHNVAFHWNRGWNWNRNRNRHWLGHWPLYWGINYQTRCWTAPGYYYPTQTVVVNEPAAAAPAEPAPIAPEATAGSADLVLEDLELAAPATLLAGPAYRIKFRNQGSESVGRFRIGMLAAAGGEPSEDAPQAVVEMAGLAAGETGEVTIRLPQAAMKLVAAGGQSTGFTHLFVALDIDGVTSESDKQNNVAVVERAQLAVASR